MTERARNFGWLVWALDAIECSLVSASDEEVAAFEKNVLCAAREMCAGAHHACSSDGCFCVRMNGGEVPWNKDRSNCRLFKDARAIVDFCMARVSCCLVRVDAHGCLYLSPLFRGEEGMPTKVVDERRGEDASCQGSG